MSNFVDQMESMETSGLDPATLATLKNLQKMDSVQESIRENAKEARSGYDSSKGIEFLAFVEYAQKGASDVVDGETKITSPQRTTIKIIQLPASVNSIYGVVEEDMRSDDPHINGVTQMVNANNSQYVPDGSTVLKVKARPTQDPMTGASYDKNTRIKNRPVTIIQCLRAGDTIRGGMFTVENPKMPDGSTEIPIGSVVRITGAKAHDYNGRAMWNFGSVTLSPVNVQDLHSEMFSKQIRVPRNSYRFMKINEAPVDWSLPYEARVELSPDLQEFISSEILICTWPTDLSDQKRMVTEATKKKNALYQPPVFLTDPADYGGHAEARDNQPERSYSRVNFFQTVLYKDTTRTADQLGFGEKPEQSILLDIRMRELQCAQLLGISNPVTFKSVALEHVPKMRFAFMAKPGHKETFNSDMNKNETKGVNFSDIDFKLVYKSSATSFSHSNLKHYVYTEGLPVTLAFVKEAVAGGKSSFKSAWHSKNFFNSSTVGNDFLVLSEYDGPVEDFAENYNFRLLSSRGLIPMQRNAIDALDDEEERAKACSASLLGKPNDSLGLGSYKQNTVVVYAIKKSLCDAMDAEPGKYDFSDVMKIAEDAAHAYDPAEADKELASMQRVLAERQANAMIGNMAGDKRDRSDQSSGGSPSKRARNSDGGSSGGGDDDDDDDDDDNANADDGDEEDSA